MSSFFKSIFKFFKKLFSFIRKYFAIFLIIFIILTPYLMPLIGLGGTWVAMLPSWLSWLPTFVSFFGSLGFPGVIFAALGIGYLVDGDATTGIIKDAVDVAGDIVKEGTDVIGNVIDKVIKAIPPWFWIGLGAFFLLKSGGGKDKGTKVEVHAAEPDPKPQSKATEALQKRAAPRSA